VIGRSERSRRLAATLAAVGLVLTLALAIAPAAARAAAIASSVTGFTGGPALAADGRVILGEHRGDGALRILAIDPRSKAKTQIARFAPLADPLGLSLLHLTGTGGVVAGTLDTAHYATGPGTIAGSWKPLYTRTLTLLPSFALVSACPQLPNGLQALAAGGDGFVATVGGGCATDRSAVSFRTATGSFGVPALPEAGDRPDIAPDVIALAADGPMAAWVELRVPVSGQGPSLEVVLLDVDTQQLLLRIPLGGFVYGIGLGADGTIALPDITTCSIRVLSPAAPAIRAVPLPAGLCPQALLSIGVAGDRVVYQADGGYAVSDLQGDAHWLADGAGSGSPIAFDGTTAYVLRKDCDADHLLAIDVDAAGAPPPHPAHALSTCRVRRSGASQLRISASGHLKLGLRCPAGCRGTLRLVQQRGGHLERLAGSADYAQSAGTRALAATVAPFARALAGCAGGMHVRAVLYPAADEDVVSKRRTLGSYVLSSRSRCRRSGGPPFAAPLPAPRP
jgi:hypothetical protein